MIQNTRIRKLNDSDRREDGSYVLYWMQEAQRTHGNPALETAIRGANKYGLPVVVCFGLMDGYPDANARHYAFMLEGLADCAQILKSRGIAFVVRRGMPADVATDLAKDATAVVCDRSYMPDQIRWREELADAAGCAVSQVETEVVVPVDVASDKSEYAARTIRPKIHRVWDEYLVPLDETEPEIAADTLGIESESDIDVSDPAAALAALDLDRAVAPVKRFKGGEVEAHRRLDAFVAELLDGYAEGRNEPSASQTSLLSPYLHFGHISPVDMALAARNAGAGSSDDRGSFIEELIVRRELAMNYVAFEPKFGSYGALPDWARRTLDEHAGDAREHVYTMDRLEACDTHDPHWNDAMREMVHTGFMHNYMRMYWAKKILEWSPTPQQAFETTLALNNKYFLDGRDPNSYANVAWCYGLHDRAWTERPRVRKDPLHERQWAEPEIRHGSVHGIRRRAGGGGARLTRTSGRRFPPSRE
ncbi:MAG: deoxyribodipyrimidine photo-lyase [Alphaproteobacteria bacterium]